MTLNQRSIAFILFMLGCSVLSAQGPQTGVRRIQAVVLSDSIVLDTLPVPAASITVMCDGKTVSPQRYTVGAYGNVIYPDSSLRGSTLDITYRVIHLPAGRTYSHKSTDLIEPVFTREPRSFYNYSRQEEQGALFGDGLNVFGNIARGLGFGNNQDLVLNSNLNLQLSGKLGKGVVIRAAISDENNPIQPQGNTQQIQDFDKVFISISKDSNSITVGDFLMATGPDEYFLKYYKKSRGVRLDYLGGGKYRHIAAVNAAVSRGRFARNEIQGQEGVQGPYRLQGTNGELNIIVISGTETIYFDGERLERGQQNDYVIDYNTGELYFMPGRMISRYNRIVAEFQYSDRNYARSVFTVNNQLQNGRWSGGVHYFSEQDNRFQPTDTSGGSVTRRILENSGDERAVYSFEKKYDRLQTDRVNYRKTDSLGFGIYVFTNDPLSDTAFYTLTFSFTGKGKGNYVQIASSANGRVFAWVQPVGGIPQGDYEPYTELIAPKRLQMLSAHAGYHSGSGTEIRMEAAWSNLNSNTLSVLDKRNDDGMGLFFSLNRNDMPIGALRLSTRMKAEFVSRNFNFVERYRSVEFNRIWNRKLDNSTASARNSELITSLGMSLKNQKGSVLSVEASAYNKGSDFNGYRGLAGITHVRDGLSLKFSQELLTVSSNSGNVRGSNTVSVSAFESVYDMKAFRAGASATREMSRFGTDTGSAVSASSFLFEQLSGFFESDRSERLRYRLDATYRTDYLPGNNTFRYGSTGTNVNGRFEFAGKKLNRVNFTGSYRLLNEAGNLADEEVILSRIEYNGTFFRKVLQTSTYYQVGTGREQKRQFSYALVQSGNGTHTWIDYNSNGIEEINEFEPAVFKDQARYVKIFLPGNEFIKSNTNEFNQTIRLQAPQQWHTGNFLKRMAGKLYSVTTYKADRRITDNSLLTILNPLKLNVADSSLISVSSLIKQTTFFNRSGARFGIEHNIQTGKSKQFLYSGFEWRQSDRQQAVARVALSRQFNLALEGEQTRKQNRNDFFENRNYDYQAVKLRPELFFQSVKGFRVGTYYSYTEAENAPEYGNDLAYIGEAGLEMRYFIINKGNIDAKIASHRISFSGNQNSPLAFDLLNGLSNGRNLTWNVGFGGKTKGNIQFNLSYEGRKTEIYKTVHIGRAEARYIF